ncbi:MAG: flagellin lysine-N-methylase [Eubacterium sp.]|nr:flagellin lysine-N-methylase [Eubacterium sp.]
MIIRAFEYFFDFKCIADRCEDTCCAGWEIDIDDESYEAYMQVPGELGEKLRKNIKTYDASDLEFSDGGYEEIYEQHGFVLGDDLRCPFLQKNNLCELYGCLGEQALCEVCTNTPRNFLEYGGVREVSLSASCPESARLLYESDRPLVVAERQTDEAFPFEESEEELRIAGFVKEARDRAIEILQNREYDIGTRIELFMLFSERVQEKLNRTEIDPDALDGVPDVPEMDELKRSDVDNSAEENGIYRNFLIRMNIYSGLASIGEAWKNTVENMYELFVGEDDGQDSSENAMSEKYVSSLAGLDNLMRNEKREYEYEHLAVYYAFLLLARCVDDMDFLGRAKLVKMSYLFGHDMDAAAYVSNGAFLKKDREKNARIYAREVEHSEENLYNLHEEMLFS